jgi:hypothetical protein
VVGDRVTFTFSPAQRTLRDVLEQNRALLESTAQAVAGRKMTVAAELADAAPSPSAPPVDERAEKAAGLREQALADAGVQALLEVFPAEIRDIEEM